MLRVKEEENSQGGSRGRSFSRKWADELSEDEEEEEEDEEEIFSESELELYEQYKAAGYRDLVSVSMCVFSTNRLQMVAKAAKGPQTLKHMAWKKRCKFTN